MSTPVMATHWNSPETAPKDGTRILARVHDIHSDDDAMRVEIVSWCSWYHADPIDKGWKRLDDMTADTSGMVYVTDIHGWMPLPAP